MTLEQLKALKSVSDKVNEVNAKLNFLIATLDEKRSGDIEYLAMMTDVDLDPEEEVEEESEE